jgi:hypothetical protein
MHVRSRQLAFVEEHCGGMDHSSSTFFAHLLGTEAILEIWDCRPHVCRAGLFHSIYGTDPAKSPPVSLDSRDEVRDLIGSRAEALAYRFCATPRDALLGNLRHAGKRFEVLDRFLGSDIAISKETFRDLVTIEVANSLEQRPRRPVSNRDNRRRDFELAAPYLPPAAKHRLEAVYSS